MSDIKFTIIDAPAVNLLTCAIRTSEVAALIINNGGELWGDHPQYPKSDWKYEVENGDTFLGYWEWVYCKLDEAEMEGGS